MFCKKLVFIHFQTLSGPFGLKTKHKKCYFSLVSKPHQAHLDFKHSVKKWFTDPSRSLSISRWEISSFTFERGNFKSQYSNFRLQIWKMGWAAWAVGAEIRRGVSTPVKACWQVTGYHIPLSFTSWRGDHPPRRVEPSSRFPSQGSWLILPTLPFGTPNHSKSPKMICFGHAKKSWQRWPFNFHIFFPN